MDVQPTVIASGNLASARRTITGVLGQLSVLDISREQALSLFTQVGLPSRALAEPDFPISLQQELRLCLTIGNYCLATQSPATALFAVHQQFGIEHLGVLGMAMRHADTAIDALKICLQYPQLSWGHCRLVVRREKDATSFSFTMERPDIEGASQGEVDRLVEYCLVLDLVSSLRNIQDIVDSDEAPLYVTLPFAEPADWAERELELPYPVHFDHSEARLVYPTAFDGAALPRANGHLYRSYKSVAQKLSMMLAEEIGLEERVTRWLWAYTPPLKRGEIASQLAMSERNLTRQLKREGTSYARLLARVQEERAKNFLRNPSWSVSEIGYRLGYSEPAAFSRAFAGWTGVSPLKWRQAQG